jgi:uncharacterized damage-inducible protein DinB
MRKIFPSKGYTPHMGILVSNFSYTRRNTLFLAKNLSVEQLDFNFDYLSNSIGTLLMHIAALEFEFLVKQILNRKPTKIEDKKYSNAIGENMNKRMIKNNNLEYYVEELTKNRDLIFEKLKNYNDDWLFSEINVSENTTINNYYLLRHVIDDELCHQGQIKLIRKRL